MKTMSYVLPEHGMPGVGSGVAAAGCKGQWGGHALWQGKG